MSQNNQNNDITMILKRILGDKCQDVIDMFKDQEIDAEAFYSLDKDVLVELGIYMQAFFIHLFSLFILFSSGK